MLPRIQSKNHARRQKITSNIHFTGETWITRFWQSASLKGGSIQDDCIMNSCLLFSTCQVRVSRFHYWSCFLLPSVHPSYLPPSIPPFLPPPSFSSGAAGPQTPERKLPDARKNARNNAGQNRCQIEGQIKCQSIIQKKCQTECQNTY